MASYFVLWAILIAQVFWVCESEPGWKVRDTAHFPSVPLIRPISAQVPIVPQCKLGMNVAIAQLISRQNGSVFPLCSNHHSLADIYADTVLITAPLRLLWNLGVSTSQRRRLLLVFSSCIGTTIASLVHAYYVLRVGGLDEVFVAICEVRPANIGRIFIVTEDHRYPSRSSFATLLFSSVWARESPTFEAENSLRLSNLIPCRGRLEDAARRAGVPRLLISNQIVPEKSLESKSPSTPTNIPIGKKMFPEPLISTPTVTMINIAKKMLPELSPTTPILATLYEAIALHHPQNCSGATEGDHIVMYIPVPI